MMLWSIPLLSLIAWLQRFLSTSATPPQLLRRDAPFEDVRPSHMQKDHSKAAIDRIDHPEKYFHEAQFHTHYDGRFAARPLPEDQKSSYLVPLIQTYLLTMADAGVDTLLMHGTLLAWYWSRGVFPWDDDVDVMVSESGIAELAGWWNMTVHTFYVPLASASRSFLLEVNPYFDGGGVDVENAIDARWICMESGLFIDVTTVRRNWISDDDGAMMVKDKHQYRFDDIFPLRKAVFEGVDTRVPSAYADVLVEEYGPDALTLDRFNGFEFSPDRQQWIVAT